MAPDGDEAESEIDRSKHESNPHKWHVDDWDAVFVLRAAYD